MPKMRSNRGAAKRFKVTGSGKPRRGRAGLRHGMIGKRRSRKRKLSGFAGVAGVDESRVLRMLGRR